MEFSSIEFIGFLTITLIVFHLLKPTFRWAVLVLASMVFIYMFSIKFLAYTIGFALVNYLLGIVIAKASSPGGKRALYIIGIWANIAFLIFYKYINFILDNVFSVLQLVDNNIETPFLKLIVPLGISFYTFQSIGYLVDLYRGTIQAEKHLGKFLLFILYFPKFISGPVERATNLLPQLEFKAGFDNKKFNDGLLQMLWGFIKTLIISDRLAMITNEVNGNLHDTSGTLLFINFFIQFLYLYFNFSGYTDIVLGISKLFGISLLPNFERPLLATSVTNYWKRWHMSLTTWCNDYIFRKIILKRMRWKKWASVYGVFITFLIIGIWHGANWTFIILGLLQGLALNYEFFTKRTRLKIGGAMPLWLNNSLSRIFTFLFICFSHVFFFSSNIQDSLYYLGHMFDLSSNANPASLPMMDFKDILIAGIGGLFVLTSEWIDEKRFFSSKEKLHTNKLLFWIVVAIVITLLIIFGVKSGSEFIYKQF